MSATRVGDWDGEATPSDLTSYSDLISRSIAVVGSGCKEVAVKDSSLALNRSTVAGLNSGTRVGL